MTEKTKAVKASTPTAEEAHEANLEVDELLADMPELIAPERLRLRHRNRLMGIFLRADADGTLMGGGEVRDPKKLESMLNMLGEVDEFAESIALDKEAYAEWSIANGDNYNVFSALLQRYASAVGESAGSSK